MSPRNTEGSVSRRRVVQALPALALFSVFGGLGRILSACVALDDPNTLRDRRRAADRTPGDVSTDDGEYVDDRPLTPVSANDVPPAVPNRAWESRAKQLEDEQARLYGAVFTRDPAGNGVMAGKERSHVPQVSFSFDTQKRAVVVVQHVMGKNGLDAGADAALDVIVREADAATDDAAIDDAAAASNADADADMGARGDAGSRPEHYISTIYLRAIVDGRDTVVGLWEFSSTDPAPASIRFTLPARVTSVVAYEWCTVHGLWKSDAVATA